MIQLHLPHVQTQPEVLPCSWRHVWVYVDCHSQSHMQKWNLATGAGIALRKLSWKHRWTCLKPSSNMSYWKYHPTCLIENIGSLVCGIPWDGLTYIRWYDDIWYLGSFNLSPPKKLIIKQTSHFYGWKVQHSWNHQPNTTRKKKTLESTSCTYVELQ